MTATFFLCGAATVCMGLWQFVGLLQFVWDWQFVWDCCSLGLTVCVGLWQFVWDCDSLCGTATVCMGLWQFVWDSCSLYGTVTVCVGQLQFVWDCDSLHGTATVCVQHLQFACVGLLQFVCNTYSLPVWDCYSLWCGSQRKLYSLRCASVPGWLLTQNGALFYYTHFLMYMYHPPSWCFLSFYIVLDEVLLEMVILVFLM